MIPPDALKLPEPFKDEKKEEASKKNIPK